MRKKDVNALYSKLSQSIFILQKAHTSVSGIIAGGMDGYNN